MRTPEQLAPGVQRVELRSPTLPPATHTSAWILGGPEVIVVDPASPWDDEKQALDEALDGLAAAGRRVRAIFLTHHHGDHFAGAMHLRERLQVPICAHATTAALLTGFVTVDRNIAEDEVEALPAGGGSPALRLRALHTPGHAPGHLCWFDAGTRTLIAGDMIAGLGFIVIDPDDHGDMTQYLDSLRRLRALQPALLLPAHGPAPRGDAAPAKLDEYVSHRLGREAKVEAALQGAFAAHGPATRGELLPIVYADVAPAMYFVADRSLAAHLSRLVALGRARLDGERYSPT